jgi:predicted permease
MRMTHETIVRLAERGIPVPPELLEPPRQKASGLRGGLVLIALGAGLSIFFMERGGPWSIGLIPGLMGVALLIAWAIESKTRNRSEPPR